MNQDPSPEERQKYILETLAAVGRVSTTDLSVRFEISEDTARRDLREMAAAGLVQRVHGGALPVSPAGEPFAKRYRIASEEKARLAQRAVELISPGQLLIMDGGTTNLELARRLPRDLTVTIVTNSPRIAIETSDHAWVEVIVLGGVFDKRSQMMLGARVLEELAKIRADLCFLGMHGIHSEFGLTTTGFDEATIKTAMMRASAEVVALVTADKFGTAAAYNFGTVTELECIVAEKTAAVQSLAQEVGKPPNILLV